MASLPVTLSNTLLLMDGRSRRVLRRQTDLLRSSPLFDPAWYRSRYAEAMGQDEDPALHYLVLGAATDFDPGPRFSSKGYYDANPDVADAEVNPLVHYLQCGRREGRMLSPVEARRPRQHGRRGPRQWLLAALHSIRRAIERPVSHYCLVGGQRSEDRALLRRVTGVPPTGWCQVTVHSAQATGDLSLQVLSRRAALEAELAGPPGAPLLLRLPSSPARLGLRRDGGAGLAVDLARWPDQVDVRSIGWTEAMARLLAPLAASPGALAAAAWRRELGATLRAYFERHSTRQIAGYANWVRLYDTPTRAQLALMHARATSMTAPPLISVIVPTFETPANVLREMLASVRGQIYPHWQLCIADDASRRPHVREILASLQAEEPRARVCLRERNGNVSAASNSALALAHGDFAALLDHDDLLPPQALLAMAGAIQHEPAADLLYSDEDKIDARGRRYDPYFKPDYNPELLQSQNFVSHLGVYRMATVRALGGFREGYEGSQDYDLALRVAARPRARIVHVPQILYHWRLYPGAETYSSRHLARATDAARRAIADQAAGQGEDIRVVDGVGHYHRVLRPAPAAWPRVSAIIPTRDGVQMLRECLDGLMKRTRYDDLEVIVVDNASTDPATLAYLRDIERRGVRVLPYPAPFNYSALNNMAARAASGEWLLLLNNDVSVLEPGWLQEMVQRTRAPRVGAVGARLIYPDRTVQHAGVVLGLGGAAGHLYVGAGRHDAGYFGQLQMARETSAVTAACMLVGRTAFWQAGGLDEENLPVAFNDVDLCLRLHEAGWRIVWTPFAELVHHESRSRGSDFTAERVHKFRAEVAYIRRRWGEALQRDPFFNPNLSLDNAWPTTAFPPRHRPWDPRDAAALETPAETARLAAA